MQQSPRLPRKHIKKIWLRARAPSARSALFRSATTLRCKLCVERTSSARARWCKYTAGSGWFTSNASLARRCHCQRDHQVEVGHGP
ncbi:hypothetical protein CYMTET_8944 [Cymbomonas tetramitiformis]|uniref:Uncharacterized protein n=1 Tax=Cymbomonas tetramitiformis TaxID=36881 RepID=A0AAE0LG01_9CHLO|nr:hypothetical protein CYMTET_8944 [Cymbomonas tetramitiformis]